MGRPVPNPLHYTTQMVTHVQQSILSLTRLLKKLQIQCKSSVASLKSSVIQRQLPKNPPQSRQLAHGAPMGDGSFQWRGLIGLGARGSSHASGPSPQCTCGGWQRPMARAHRRRGQEVQPSQWSQLTVRLWGIAAANGAGSQAGATGRLAQLVVAHNWRSRRHLQPRIH